MQVSFLFHRCFSFGLLKSLFRLLLSGANEYCCKIEIVLFLVFEQLPRGTLWRDGHEIEAGHLKFWDAWRTSSLVEVVRIFPSLFGCVSKSGRVELRSRERFFPSLCLIFVAIRGP